MSTTPVAIPDFGAAPEVLATRGRPWLLPHLVRCATGRCSPAHGSMVDADAVVVFDFGVGGSGAPTASNEQLVRIALRFGIVPLLAQTEAAEVMATTGRVVIDIQAMAQREHQRDDQYVDTTGAARAAATFLAETPSATVGVIAHPAHAARCAAICEADGLRVVIPAQVNAVEFDPASAQPWTRRRSFWIMRKMELLIYHSISGAFRRRS